MAGRPEAEGAVAAAQVYMLPSLAEWALLAASMLAPPALQDLLPFVSRPLSALPHLPVNPSMCLHILRESVAIMSIHMQKPRVHRIRFNAALEKMVHGFLYLRQLKMAVRSYAVATQCHKQGIPAMCLQLQC